MKLRTRSLPLIFMLCLLPGQAAGQMRSDADLLADTLTACIDRIADAHGSPDEGIVAVQYGTPAAWTQFARGTVETALTTHGFAIADSAADADATFSLDAAAFRVILMEDGDSWERTVSAGFHYAIIDSGGTILSADHIDLTESDILPKLPDEANDAFRFSPAARRIVIGRPSNRLRIASLVVFTGTILWLAFR